MERSKQLLSHLFRGSARQALVSPCIQGADDTAKATVPGVGTVVTVDRNTEAVRGDLMDLGHPPCKIKFFRA